MLFPVWVPLQEDDDVLVKAITAIVREADEAFQRSGGSSRHWVRECFLPTLNAKGFRIISHPAQP